MTLNRMNKPNNLRRHLIAANPDLRNNPDKLLMFADKGQVVAAGGASLSFEYQYSFNIIITDYQGDTNAIVVPLLAWVAVNQPELLYNPDLRKTGISFEIDYNNQTTLDLSINLAITERIIVTKDGNTNTITITQPPEPQFAPDYTHDFWQLYTAKPNAQNALLAEWITPSPAMQAGDLT